MSSNSIDKKSSESPMPKPSLSGLNLMASSPNLDRMSTNVLQKVPDFTLPLGIIVTGPIQARRSDSVEPKSSLLTLSRSPKINSKLAHAGGTPPPNTTLMKKGTPNAVLKSAAGKDRSLLKKNDSIGHTESEDSEVDSMEGDHHANKIPPLDLKTSNVPAPVRLPVVGDEWEILEGLRNGQLCNDAPNKFCGYMMKSRKWPMKGWHKRYFLLETGILTYAKSSADLEKGKYHGTMDIGLSVIAYKQKGRRIDVDADDLIYHLKAKTSSTFEEWIGQLRHHRLYRQHELSYGTNSAPKLVDVNTPVDEYSPMTSPLSPGSPIPPDSRGGSFKCRSLDRSQNRVAAWLIDSHGVEAWNKELTMAQNKIFELGAILEQLNSSKSNLTGSWTNINELQDLSNASSKKDKVNKKYLALKNAAKKDRKHKDRLSTPEGMLGFHMSSSNPNLLSVEVDHGSSVTSSETCSNDHERLYENFCVQAKTVHETLKGICHMVMTERERLKRAIERENSTLAAPTGANYIFTLKQSLSEALKQNSEMRNKLMRIHAESSVGDAKPILSPMLIPTGSIPSSGPPSERAHTALAPSGSVESQSEFYDASERLDSSFTDDSEEEEEYDEEISDTENNALHNADENQFSRFQIRRRSKLPVPKVDTDLSLWSLLCKNIGKDLSKISMPVSLNEPLNALQRLCEELEYSELLDRVVEMDDPYERMVIVAAFAVSAYASTYTRAGQKPFNPLLGETYECVREDKGWKFISEQVSHHPPVAACFCESKNFVFWQDMQVKTKFWGKSMEILPIGNVNLKLPSVWMRSCQGMGVEKVRKDDAARTFEFLFRFNRVWINGSFKEQYTWNKATSCVHNILGGQRWVDHYGEVVITNQTRNIVCKLTFAKSGYWSSKRHEVFGSVVSPEGQTVHHLFGKWNEGLYWGDSHSAKCIWRPGALPPDSDIYYGFSRFAIELNEIDSEQIHLYPPTDTRFRPDQRLLEEGKIFEADTEKQRLEQFQREQRKKRDEESTHHAPRWFLKTSENGGEHYVFNGKYWDARKDPGFMKMTFPRLW